MENELVNSLIAQLKDNDLWFTTKNDPTIIEPGSYYELDEYGCLSEKAIKKIAKEIDDYIGDGAVYEEDAIELWINDALMNCTIDYIDNLRTQFKDKPIIDQIEAYENPIQLAESKEALQNENKELKTEIASINDPLNSEFTTGKWRVEIRNKEGAKPVAYFYDMSQDKSKFPDGQFTYSYYVETLLGKDGYGKPIDEMSAFCLDNSVPEWTIEGNDLKEIAEWLRKLNTKTESIETHDLSKDLFGDESDKRNTQKQKDYEKHLGYVKDILAGKTVIDDKYHEELDLDTAKKWLSDDYVYLNNLSSASPEEVNKRLAKDLPEIFGESKEVELDNKKL